ncbi:MAG TPA: DinB family protein, partial [Solirubrobacterales bacterium]
MTASSSTRVPDGSKDAIAERLAEARRRTLELVEPLDDEQLNRVYSSLLSPLAWDLGHIANFEELWLVRRIGGRAPLRGELGRLYDAIE